MLSGRPADAANAVQRVLSNGPLPAGQQALLRTLYQAGPAGLTGTELVFEMTQEGGQWHYRMRDVLRKVLEEQRPAWL